MKWRIFPVLATLAVSAFAWGAGPDPDSVLKQISDLQAAANADRQAGKQVDMAEVMRKSRDLAKQAIEGLDPATVEANKSYAWAKLFQEAGDYKPVAGLIEKFVTTNPAKEERYQAMYLGVLACLYTDDIDRGVSFLENAQPYNDQTTISLIGLGMWFSEGIMAKSGHDAALKFLDGLETRLPGSVNGEQATLSLNGTKNGLLTARADVLADAGRKDEAITLLDKAIQMAGDDARLTRGLKAKRSQLTLLGSVAPAVTSSRGYGEFKGLEAYKGKVVILDFFAHWCGPCKASFPDLRKLYDDLHSKGLEIFHLTKMYGYFDAERNLTPDQEFERMEGFIEKHKIAWPVLYVSDDVFANYGVSGIPHIAVVDKSGKVHKLKIGYSAESFVEFRKMIEQMVEAAE